MSRRDGVILLGGFEPFGGDCRNPSLELVRALDGCRIGRRIVVACDLPCEFGRAAALLTAAVDRLSPRLVVATGQAAGRAGLSFERVAINRIDARIADNAGSRPIDVTVLADAPASYPSTLPLDAMVDAARRAGIPASISDSAGSFVCNEVFYRLQHHLAATLRVPGGFVHLPLLPEQAAGRCAAGEAEAPSMTIGAMVDGLRAALAAASRPRRAVRPAAAACNVAPPAA